MIHSIRSVAGLIALVTILPRWTAAADNAIYNELVGKGIALSNGKTVTLPSPVMADGLKADDQQKVLKTVGPQNIPNNMKSFLRGDRTDWYEIKQKSERVADPQASIGRVVDLYFVAKGKLATVADPNFVNNQIANSQQKDVQFYIPAELAKRNLTINNKKDFRENYAHGLIKAETLFNKVQVGGTGYGIETLTPDSILVAFKLDPRFDKDSEFPNQYQLATVGADGKITLGPPKLYSGYGGYSKITKLQGSEDKIFVEYHLVFDEPHEWFNGTAQLVSKLETNYTENIRQFRRDVLNPPAAGQQQPNAKTEKK
jgi:hypothetical protein